MRETIKEFVSINPDFDIVTEVHLKKALIRDQKAV
jgi:hypothetical protein